MSLPENTNKPKPNDVLRWQHWATQQQRAAVELLARYGLELSECNGNEPIPGSFWGDDEAGLIGNVLYVRADTPVHSLLHESCHYICMTPVRRRSLHTNAGGSVLEECAVCYLQVLLAEALGITRSSLFSDMDSWGYSFRLGSAGQWFCHDASDAIEWLMQHELVNDNLQATGQLRQ